MEKPSARKESKYLEKWSGKAGAWQVTSPWALASSILKVSPALRGSAHSSGRCEPRNLLWSQKWMFIQQIFIQGLYVWETLSSR